RDRAPIPELDPRPGRAIPAPGRKCATSSAVAGAGEPPARPPNLRPRRRAPVIVGHTWAEQESMEPTRVPEELQLSIDPACSSARSWLCRDESERLRLLDMEGRVRPVRQRAFAI